MATAPEEQVTVRLPNAMSAAEMIAEGRTPEQAIDEMHRRVFGAKYQRDKGGKPVEVGRGAPGNETVEHKEALAIAIERKAHANPNSADIIAKAVAEGVKAGLAAAAPKAKPETF
jgi:hypothetical protein